MARRKVITCESCGTREYMEKSIEVELEKQVGGKLDDTQVKQIQQEQQVEHEQKTEQLIKDVEKAEQQANEEQLKETILEMIMSSYKELTKEQKVMIKNVLVSNGVQKLQELSLESLKGIASEIK